MSNCPDHVGMLVGRDVEERLDVLSVNDEVLLDADVPGVVAGGQRAPEVAQDAVVSVEGLVVVDV